MARRSLFRRLAGRAGASAASLPASPPPLAAPPKTGQPPFTDRDRLIAEARGWGYFAGAIKSRRDLWANRNILDIGMGGGPHAVSFMAGGAASYVGVDPLVGTDKVRDFRNPADPTLPAYHAFPYTPADIMRLLPGVHLYSGLLEDVADEVKAHRVDIAILSAVTEHLAHPHEVIRAIWEILEPGGDIWICHCNYYSWTGHHRAPRSVKDWKRTDKEQARHVDWQHLEPTHPDYANPNFNRIRLHDLRALIEAYFEIIEWNVSVEALERLTPQLRRKWRKYSLEELLGQNIYITARRRDTPLPFDASTRELLHPSESYLADADYSGEDIAPFTLAHAVHFSSAGELCSHSDNNHAGMRVFARVQPGDVLTLQKFTSGLRLTVAEVTRRESGELRLTFAEEVPASVLDGNHDQWTILDYGLGAPAAATTPQPLAEPQPAGASSMPPRRTTAHTATVQPLPGLDLMTATLNAIDGLARDMADVRYLVRIAKAIGAEPYEALQMRHTGTRTSETSSPGQETLLDIPYWIARRLGVARLLGLLDGWPQRSLLDLGAGGGHLLRIACDHGHRAIGLDAPDPLVADIAALLAVERLEVGEALGAAVPDLGVRFNVVTAIRDQVLAHPADGRPDDAARSDLARLGIDAWAFLLEDLALNHLKYPARIYVDLGAEISEVQPGLLDWFVAEGATVTAKSAIVDLTLTAPRHFRRA